MSCPNGVTKHRSLPMSISSVSSFPRFRSSEIVIVFRFFKYVVSVSKISLEAKSTFVEPISVSKNIFLWSKQCQKMKLARLNCPSLNDSDQNWPVLTKTDPLWPKLTRSDQNWPVLIKTDLFWPKLTRPDQNWPVLTKTDPVQTDPVISNLGVFFLNSLTLDEKRYKS